MRYLLDTCAISEPIKQKTNQGLVSWLQEQDENRLFLSVVTLGELNKGISKLNKGHSKKASLKKWVNEDLAQRFDQRILHIDDEIAAQWGKLLGEGEQSGQCIPAVDALIAATALVHDLTIVTRNTNDLRHIDISMKNPWK